MDNVFLISACATLSGFFGRLLLLKVDYRQYPSYPKAYLSHIVLGFIASSLGAVFLPALLSGEFTAVTFLTLAASQFREIRSMERDSLVSLEGEELVKRGVSYIEDISKRFEARNYVAMISAFSSSVIMYVLPYTLYTLLLAMLFGIITALTLGRFMKTSFISDIANIDFCKIILEGPFIVSEGVTLTNVGDELSRGIILEKARAVKIVPKTKNAEAFLSNMGQRQAILHNISIVVGIRKDIDEIEFTPVIKRDKNKKGLIILYIPLTEDDSALLDAIKKTPLLESAGKVKKNGKRKNHSYSNHE